LRDAGTTDGVPPTVPARTDLDDAERVVAPHSTQFRRRQDLVTPCKAGFVGR
jgi:hypothetical protein